MRARRLGAQLGNPHHKRIISVPTERPVLHSVRCAWPCRRARLPPPDPSPQIDRQPSDEDISVDRQGGDEQGERSRLPLLTTRRALHLAAPDLINYVLPPSTFSSSSFILTALTQDLPFPNRRGMSTKRYPGDHLSGICAPCKAL